MGKIIIGNLLILVFFFLFGTKQLLSQYDTPPNHQRLIYSNDFYVEGSSEGAEITDFNHFGSWVVGKGWEASTDWSQLIVGLNEPLPYEATIEFDALTIHPPYQVTDDVVFWSIYSRPDVNFYTADTSMASYILLKTDPDKIDGEAAEFVLYSASYRGNQNLYNPNVVNRKMTEGFGYRVWEAHRYYHFKIIYNTKWIWAYVDGDLLAKHEFNGQMERFQYLTFGRDNTFNSPSTMVGQYFAHLKIYGPEVELPFADVTFKTDTPGYSMGGYGHGVSFTDINLDGYPDILTSNYLQTHALPDHLYVNQADGTFLDEAPLRSIEDVGGTHAILNADFDNDGDLDVFHANMPITSGSPLGRNALYLNNGNGYYQDITDVGGIIDANNTSRSALALDIENDGDLDIYVVNQGELNELYVNNGSAVFSREDRGANGDIEDINVIRQQGASAADFDNDGDIDIYICRSHEAAPNAPNLLFVNDGSGNFTEEAQARGVAFNGRSNGASFADIDNDGDLDLFVVNSTAEKDLVVNMNVALNNGDGSFQDRTQDYDIKLSGYNALFLDIDNDADLDLYLIRNDVLNESARPELFLNDGTGGLSRVGYTEAMIPAKDARGAAYADIDNDGDLDFYVAAKYSHNYMVRNDIENDNSYIRVLPLGPGGDYGGFCTKVTVYEPGHLGEPGYILGYQHAQSTFGYLSQNQPALHFGLANFGFCDIRLEFTNGAIKNFNNISANQVLSVEAVIPVAKSIEQHEFDLSTGQAGQELDSPVSVLVLDQDRNPVSDHPVNFAVNGQGFINQTQKNVEIRSDGSGIASVTWTLGETAGIENRLVARSSLEGVELDGSPVNFSVHVEPGPDTLLAIHSGNNQSGRGGEALPEPIVVSVLDKYGNPHKNVAVQFQVENGNGNFNGELTTVVNTNSQGLANISWTLDDSENEQQTATAFLFSDPTVHKTFTAYNESVLAARMLFVSGDSAIGIAGGSLSAPIKVQIVSEALEPVPDFPVIFNIPNGGMHFNGAAEIQVLSDENGLATVLPTVGESFGDFQLFAKAQKQDEHLVGSPMLFTCKVRNTFATTLQNLTADNLTGKTSSFLNTHLIIKAEGTTGDPVAGHDVSFKVVKGNGKLGNSLSDSVTVKTDEKGIAKVAYKLGDEIGENNNQVLVTSNDGLSPLANSPFVLTASALYGKPDSLLSTITATESVVADGESAAQVTVALLDKAGNPVSGEQVVVQIEGMGLLITQPEDPTDENGEAHASIRSEKAGEYTISGYLPTENIHLQQTATINFVPGIPFNLEKISGMEQNGVINSVLGEPVQVRVLDKKGNVVPNSPVRFTVLKGGGYVAPSNTIPSDVEGVAGINWVLGPEIGTQELEAKAVGTDAHVRFIAQAGAPGTVELSIYKGDNQIVAPGSVFIDSLVVRVNDETNSPVSGINVAFSVEQGDVILSQSAVSSTQFGLAGIAVSAGNTFGPVTIRAKIDEDNFTDFVATIAETVPVKMVAQQNNLRSGTVNDTLTTCGVQILDAEDQPAAGVSVTFSSLSDGALILSEKTVKTDMNGQAHALVKLGQQADTYLFSATASGLQGSPVNFSIAAVADDPLQIKSLNGDKQVGLGGTVLTEKISVKVMDQFGNPVRSAFVLFNVESGDGAIESSLPIETNNDGLAGALWRLGESGVQMASAALASNPQIKTFFTATLLQNLPPVITAVSDTTISEKQLLVFHVQVTDPEGTNVTLLTSELPTGAYFDAINSHNFIWTPTISQSGDYAITFTAKDEQENTRQKTVNIKVTNINRAPAISSYSPSQITINTSPYQELNFGVAVMDLDGDELSYSWLLNEEMYSNESEWGFVVAPDLPNNSQVKVIVSDGIESVSRTWNLQITQTSVDLSSFRAQSSRGSIQINWKASDEEQISGYNILRSTNKKNFNKVNSELVATNRLGDYSYLDSPEKYSPIYYYKLEEISQSGHTKQYGLVPVKLLLPSENKLYQNYPNPFNPTTKLEFQLNNPQKVELTIVNIAGQTVRTLHKGTTSAGYFTKSWDGRNNAGKMVPSGIYYCILNGQEFHQHIKLLLLK